MQEGVFEEQARPSLQKVLFCRNLSKLMLRHFSLLQRRTFSFFFQACSLTIVPCVHRNGKNSISVLTLGLGPNLPFVDSVQCLQPRFHSHLVVGHATPCRLVYAADLAMRCLHWSHVLVYRVYREERFRGVELDEFG